MLFAICGRAAENTNANVIGFRQRGEINTILRRHTLKTHPNQFRRSYAEKLFGIRFRHKLPIMFVYHCGAVARPISDFRNITLHCYGVADKTMARPIMFPSQPTL